MKKTKNLFTLIAVITAMALWSVALLASPVKPEKTRLQVGVFDSRAVAAAHFGKFIKEGGLEKLYKEHGEAEAKGDTKRAEELEAKAIALQKQVHMRIFGTAPVDDVLEEIEKDIRKVARAAEVDIVVNKWDIIYQEPSAKFVDITNQMVDLFEPDEETLEKIKSILKNPPVPRKDLEKMDHSH